MPLGPVRNREWTRPDKYFVDESTCITRDITDTEMNEEYRQYID